MNIQIMSALDAQKLIQKNPNQNMISIRSVMGFKPFGINWDNFNQPNVLTLYFDDVFGLNYKNMGFKIVESKDIKKAINWAKYKDDIVIHCTQGISRSAALAYIIACFKVGPKEAIKILDPNWHVPNEKIIELGYNILNKDPEIIKQINNFYQKQQLIK